MRRGVVCMLAAGALFTTMGALVKLLVERIPFAEVMFFRCALAMPVVALIVLRNGNWGVLRTRRLPGHVARACTGTMAMACGFYALTVLPLAEQTALTNTTPLFVTLLSIPFLGEKVGVHRWGAVVVGFLGIVVIALGQGAFQGAAEALLAFGIAVAVMQGVFSAITTLLVRSLSATEPSTTIVMWQSLLMTLITAVALPFVWVTPTWEEFLLLIGAGLLGGLGQVLLTEAWASAQVSALAPYSYSPILWAVLFGWVIFGAFPSIWTWAGAALIVAASLYILHRETRRRRQDQG